MMTETNPPLLVIFKSPDNENPREFLLQPHVGSLDEAIGHWHASVYAPNGEYVHAWISITGKEKLYDAVLQLFLDRNSKADLWLDAGNRPLSNADDVAELTACAWSAGQAVDASEWSLHQSRNRPYELKLRQERRSHIDHLQFWTNDGPSVVVPCTGSSTIVLFAGGVTSPDQISPHVKSAASDSTAYWGFLRNSVPRAAYHIGRSILKFVAEYTSHATKEQLLVAGHWIVQFGKFNDEHRAVHDALTELSSETDAAILSFALSLERRRPNAEELITSLASLLAKVKRRHPSYSPIFRLLIDRLSIANTFLGEVKHTPETIQLDQGIDWAMRLGASTYWGAERVSFRATSPDLPDPLATGRDMHVDLKKKRTPSQFYVVR